MEVIGTIKVKFDTQKVSDRFSKREFVITTEANTPYPQQVIFQVTQDKCTLLDSFNEGEEVKIQFNLRGREWNGPQGLRYFNTLEAWRIERMTGGAQAAAPQRAQQNYQNQAPAAPAFTGNAADNDDLPF